MIHAFNRPRRDLHVAEDDELLNTGDRNALDFLGVILHDKALAVLAAISALFLEIQDDDFAALWEHTEIAGGRFFGRRQVTAFSLCKQNSS